MLPKAIMVRFGDNNVIAERDAEQLSGGSKLLCERCIFLAGNWIAGRMIVHDNNTRSSVDDGVREDFARVRQDGIKRADSNSALRDQPLATIE